MNNIDIRLERNDPRVDKLKKALQPIKNSEGKLIGAMKKYPLTRLVDLSTALLGDVPRRRERKCQILSRMMK